MFRVLIFVAIALVPPATLDTPADAAKKVQGILTAPSGPVGGPFGFGGWPDYGFGYPGGNNIVGKLCAV